MYVHVLVFVTPCTSSDSLSPAQYLILYVCSVTFPIVYMETQPKPAVLLTVMSVAFVVATVGSILIIFSPKTHILLTNFGANFVYETDEGEGNADGGQPMARRG